MLLNQNRTVPPPVLLLLRRRLTIVLLSLSLPCVASLVVSADDSEVLPETTKQIAITNNQPAIFVISASVGQLLRLTLDKGDLRLTVRIYDPTGRQIFAYSSYHYETIEATAIASLSGKYKVTIQSSEQAANPSTFQVSVAGLRPANIHDQAEIEAIAAESAAESLCAEWSEASILKAITKYDEAHRIRLSLGKTGRSENVSLRTAETYFTLSRYLQARDVYERAVAEAKEAGNDLIQSEALIQIGRLDSYLANNVAAQKNLENEIRRYANRTTPDSSRELRRTYAHALSNLGEVHYSKGDLIRASERFSQALKLFTEINDRQGEGSVLLFLGYLSGAFGEPAKALDQFTQAHDLFTSINYKSGEASSLIAIGLTHSIKREDEAAIKLDREAMTIFRSIGDRLNEAIALNAQGQGYENLTEYKLALDFYQQALALGQTVSLDFRSAALYQIAGVYRLMGDLNRALFYYDQCLRVSRAAKKGRAEAHVLSDMALIYASQGNRAKALTQFDQILAFYTAIGDLRGKANASNNMGDFLLSIGENQKALSVYKQALALSREAQERGVEIVSLFNVARAARAAGHLDEALQTIDESIQLIERLRENIGSADFRSSYFSGVRRNYELKVDLLMQLERERPGGHFGAEALLASESARARSLIDTLTEARADIPPGIDPETLKRKSELEAKLRFEAEYLLATEAEDGKQPEVGSELNAIRAEYQQIQAKLRDASERHQILIRPPRLTLPEIQSELGSGTMLLEYALGNEKSYLWAVTSNSVNSYELPGRNAVESATREVYDLMTARQRVAREFENGRPIDIAEADRLYTDKAADLSKMLLGPVASQLGSNRIIVVTEGVLQYLNFEVLPAPQPHSPAGSDPQAALLIDTNEVINLPSMSTLAAIRRENPPLNSTWKLVAILADPVFSVDDIRVTRNVGSGTVETAQANKPPQTPMEDFQSSTRGMVTERLPHTEKEADAIRAIAPWRSTMFAKGFDANRETMMSREFGEYQIIHLATHGLINSEHPELSGIVLTLVKEDGSRVDGFFPLHDIYNLKLSSQLVVLSACETALGKDVKGEGLLSLTRGFMHAGAKSVVASLWKVDDRATAELMKNFYQAMFEQGLTPASALRSAKQSMRQSKSWSAPYFWAGFVLHGEYNQRIEVTGYSRINLTLLIILLLSAFILPAFIIRRRSQLRARKGH